MKTILQIFERCERAGEKKKKVERWREENDNLDVVAADVSFADDFADEEPAENFQSNEGVHETLLHGDTLPVALLGAAHELTKTGHNCGDIGRHWWVELSLGIVVELSQLGLGG